MHEQGYHPQPQQQPAPYNPQGQWYAPPPQTPQQRKSASANRSRANRGGKGGGKGGNKGRAKRPSTPPTRKQTSLVMQLVKVLVLVAVLGGVGVGGFIWKTQSDVRPYLSVFAPNVSVDGIDLSGMTWAEGSQLVWDQVNQKQYGWYVRLKNAAGESSDITAQTLGISFDPTAALQQAWAIAHDTDPDNRKDIFQLKSEIETASATTNAFFSAQQNADTSRIDAILRQLEAAAYRAPSDAYIVSFNPDNTSEPFTFMPESYGRRLDTTAVRERILRMVQNLESGEILLETETLAPSVTVAQLKETVALRCRATTPISSASTEERTENIRIAFSKINGMQLKDGQKFSFNNTVGKRSIANGFLPAIEYAYGLEQWGVGGGVCQASTTVYLAAIQGGMTILHREPHSMSVSYTELGMDATVSDTSGREIDFTFRNNSGGTVYIAAHVTRSNSSKRKYICEVRLYGPSMGGATYKLEPHTTMVIPQPEPIYKDDKDASYVTYIDETKTVKGREGHVVDSYLVTYVNGIETGRQLVSTDTYPAKADTIYVGVTPRIGGN